MKVSHKKDNVSVHLRLSRAVADKLDEMATTTRGSKSAAVTLLVSAADVATSYGPIKRIVFPKTEPRSDEE
jgi:hypothetical protein